MVDAVGPALVVSAESASWRRRNALGQRFPLAEVVFDVGESEVDGVHHSWELLATADAWEQQMVEDAAAASGQDAVAAFGREAVAVAEESAGGVRIHLEVAMGVQAAGTEAVEQQ